jgi:superfamily II DNA or RNA helicase
MKTELRPYQVEARDKAVAALRGGGGFMLLPEQRTGKTAIGLAVFEVYLKDVEYLVIACPKVAMAVWRKAIAHELPRLKELGITVHIQNYEQYVCSSKRWYKWADKRIGKIFMICDESHMIKARGASRSRVVRTLSRRAKYRLALTGTPIANGLIDAWAQFDFIDPSIFGKFDDVLDKETGKLIEEHFNGRYIRWGGYKDHSIIGYRNEEEFNEKFHKYSYRITLREAKKQGDQPPLKLQMTKSFVDLSGRSQFHYDEMLAELQTIVDGKKVKVKNLLACIVKLQQICGGTMLSPEFGHVGIGNEKLEKLHEIVRSLRGGSKFVVICRYIHEIERISGFLTRTGYDTQIVRGGMPFDGKFTCDCIVMQIQSGMAVDMSQADAILFYSTDYSYLNFEQARFRILSYAKEYARYYFLLARGTIDEQIFEAVTRKKNLAKLVVDTYRRTRK